MPHRHEDYHGEPYETKNPLGSVIYKVNPPCGGRHPTMRIERGRGVTPGKPNPVPYRRPNQPHKKAQEKCQQSRQRPPIDQDEWYRKVHQRKKPVIPPFEEIVILQIEDFSSLGNYSLFCQPFLRTKEKQTEDSIHDYCKDSSKYGQGPLPFWPKRPISRCKLTYIIAYSQAEVKRGKAEFNPQAQHP